VTAEDVLGEGDLSLHVSLDNMTLALKPTTTLAEDRCRRPVWWTSSLAGAIHKTGRKTGRRNLFYNL